MGGHDAVNETNDFKRSTMLITNIPIPVFVINEKRPVQDLAVNFWTDKNLHVSAFRLHGTCLIVQVLKPQSV